MISPQLILTELYTRYALESVQYVLCSTKRLRYLAHRARNRLPPLSSPPSHDLGSELDLFFTTNPPGRLFSTAP